MSTTSTIVVPTELRSARRLFAVPRSSYEAFLAWERARKGAQMFSPTAAERRALTRARQNRAKGKFLTFAELRHGLDFDR